MGLKEEGWEDVDWIQEDKDWWQAFVNMIMNHQVL
jgi:hypothetical protein